MRKTSSHTIKQSFIDTDGIEFIEFTTRKPQAIETALQRLGFHCVADHLHKDVRLYRQNRINFIVSAENSGHAGLHALLHGPSSNAMAFRVRSTQEALEKASHLGLPVVESTAGPMELNIPAIKGPDDSLIYLVDRYGSQSIYDIDFRFRENQARNPSGLLYKIDHVTKNVPKGTMESYIEFYEKAFGFIEMQSFHIKGEHSGLESVALSSRCGKIKIPINEPTDEKSQIAEFLQDHKGSGVQHIALSTPNIYRAVQRCRERGTEFQITHSDYYRNLESRQIPHSEDIDLLENMNILIDGGPDTGMLLQIFTQDMVGPLFFEIIQRKGNEGFGEGNFQALFESIERDQVNRGYFDEVV